MKYEFVLDNNIIISDENVDDYKVFESSNLISLYDKDGKTIYEIALNKLVYFKINA